MPDTSRPSLSLDLIECGLACRVGEVGGESAGSGWRVQGRRVQGSGRRANRLAVDEERDAMHAPQQIVEGARGARAGQT